MIITTSWDDGHPLDLRIADLLAKYSLPATFYVPIKNERPTLSPAQIRELSLSFEIGGHTVNHVRLVEVDEKRAEKEISGCKSQLEDILGCSCSVFCFPGGKYNSAHLAMVKKAGFIAARTVELFSLSSPRVQKGVALIPTTAQVYSHGYSACLRNLTKRRSVSGLMNLLYCKTKKHWLSRAEVLLAHAAAVDGVFHLWGHSWEIDQQSDWQALDHFLQKLAEYKHRARVTANAGLCVND